LAFLGDLREGLSGSGVPPELVHTEVFGPGPTAATAGPPHQPPGAPGTGPQVAFAGSRLNVNGSLEFASLLELAGPEVDLDNAGQ
jgi:hypothetical protein